MQANPPTDTVLWSDESVDGSFRFLRKLWAMVHEHVQRGVTMPYRPGDAAAELTPGLKALRLKLHRAIDKVSDDYGRRMQFNTAIAAVRELLNLYTDGKYETPVAKAVAQEVLENAILLLTPIVPHIATQLWRHLRPGTELVAIPWPKADPAALVQDTIELVVQVNGKLRAHISVAANASREEIEKTALSNESVIKFIEGKAPKKIIVVPGKLVNVVV
jgi:leucyl-tRNA synthetase